jgi:hypothetical protein
MRSLTFKASSLAQDRCCHASAQDAGEQIQLHIDAMRERRPKAGAKNN